MLLLPAIVLLAATANAEDLRYSLSKVTQDYFNIQKALAANNATLATENAQEIIWDLRNMPVNMMSDSQHKQWFSHLDRLMQASRRVSQSNNIAAQKQGYTELSRQFFETLKLFNLNKQPVYKLSCDGNVWLTQSTTVSNPYVSKGDKSKRCGNIDDILNVSKRK